MDNKDKIIKAFKDSKEPLNASKVSEISDVEKKEVDKIMKELKKRWDYLFSKKVLLDSQIINNHYFFLF